MLKDSWFSIIVASLLLLLGYSAKADVIESGIVSNEYLNFTQPNFSDASWSSTITLTIAAGSSGTRDLALFFPPNSTIGFSSTGGVSIGETSLPEGTRSATLALTANGGGSLVVNIGGGYATAAFISFEGPPLVRAVEGLPLLGFQMADEVAFYDPGIAWQTNVYIPGNWSTQGNQSGQVSLGYSTSYWPITNDFSYNPNTNETLLSVYNADYAGEMSRGNMSSNETSFTLTGSNVSVPEPAAIVLVCIGLLAMVGWRTGGKWMGSGGLGLSEEVLVEVAAGKKKDKLGPGRWRFED